MKNRILMIEDRSQASGKASIGALARSAWLIPAVCGVLVIAPLALDARALLVPVPTVVECGGGTAGFWSNKNGLALITADDFGNLTFLPLVNGFGDAADFVLVDPTDPAESEAVQAAFKTWLRQRNAENMAYQLSGQLAAFTLNVNHMKWGRPEIVGGSGWTSSQLVRMASDALRKANITLPGDLIIGNDVLVYNPNTGERESWDNVDMREWQGLLKDVLDWANNEAEFRPCP